MKYKLAILFTQPPFGTSTSREGLDALLAASAFCDEEELAEALEEIIEYVRTIAMLFYTHFNDDAQEIKPILH